MGKAKSKTAKKKATPASGMVSKTTMPSTYAKSSSFIGNKNFSSSKKGGITSTPRKAK